MNFICPKDPTHKQFLTTATVTQDWLVDADGEFVKVVNDCSLVFARPDPLNQWWCAECGTDAINTETTEEDEEDLVPFNVSFNKETEK
jgi:hypothetical protein